MNKQQRERTRYKRWKHELKQDIKFGIKRECYANGITPRSWAYNPVLRAFHVVDTEGKVHLFEAVEV